VSAFSSGSGATVDPCGSGLVRRRADGPWVVAAGPDASTAWRSSAVADIDLQRATGALKSAGIENVTTGDDHDKLSSVVADGRHRRGPRTRPC
jgi:hypothetical protein